ncbi:tyrosine-type recombinase/integrase [Acidiferrobacter sp.]|uniref:tyrosine-type recombinase/integrase n=1 Tax=Acidiferrobacter sp. TaxID=1872107 RepID=UPI00262DB194|nr:tyrosine-type recombinase/integrase [Acidiferrobacter sp.]
MAGAWPEAVRTCLDRLAYERRYSAHTLAAYRRDLEGLARFAAGQGCDAPADMTVELARRFAAGLSRAGQGGRSVARALSAARTLYRELRLGANPFRGVKAPRSPRSLPHDLTVDTLQGLLRAVPAGDLDVRDTAMAELFYGAGLRLSELRGLRLTDLDFAQGLVRVTGKGRRERLVPMGRGAQAAVQAWLVLRPVTDPLGSVFPGRNGRPLGSRAVQKRLALLGRRRGLDVPLHPHMLRHSFASHILQSSQDLRAVQELLGHAHVSTTQIYTHLDYQQLARVYDAAHPRARKRTR